MKDYVRLMLSVLMLAFGVPLAGQQTAAAPMTRFEGTWVGTQGWAIADPPPGARQDQSVTLAIEIVNGKVVGSMTPFLGGDEGLTIVDARMVGDELRARAIVGRPRLAGALHSSPPEVGPNTGTLNSGGRGAFPPGWKQALKVTLVFKNNGLNMSGTADVALGEVTWTKFTYALEKKALAALHR